MRILLTGSSGWLGQHLAPMLRDTGHPVIGLDVAPGTHTQVIGSVADAALVQKTFADHGIEAVIHAAALHKPDIARYSAQAFIDVNVTGTLNLLDAAVRAKHDRFIFTSTTSLMVREDVRAGEADSAYWMDEDFGPLAPRNIYGVTKYAAEELCRLYHTQHGLAAMVLRTGRFFPEDDDTHSHPSGPNLKANEFLNRRLTAQDAARAHIAALERAPALGFERFVLSATPPFTRADAPALMADAPTVIARTHPQAAALYAARGWVLPQRIERVYDPAKAARLLDWRASTDFGSILAALATGGPLPFAHDPAYVSPKEHRSA
jgi:UDP-glucose 4-epimerase